MLVEFDIAHTQADEVDLESNTYIMNIKAATTIINLNKTFVLSPVFNLLIFIISPLLLILLQMLSLIIQTNSKKFLQHYT